MHTLLLAALALAGSSLARTCRDIIVPVSLTSRNGVFDNIETPVSALDATTFALNLTRQGQNFTQTALTGYNTITGNYNISAKFCQPTGANATLKDPTVQLLSHGIGFDKTYWDLTYDDFHYSYINTAVDDFGYCTLSIDRLGIGLSSHGEPKNEIQSFLEVQALAAVTRMLRNGTIPTVNHSFSRVVHVGHSFGSAQTYALTAMYPDISDAVILTGFSMNASFVGYFGAGANFQQANLNQPLRFGSSATAQAITSVLKDYMLGDYIAPLNVSSVQHLDYPRGYLANSNANSLVYLFLFPGSFDENIAYFGEATKQPVSIGELLTLGSLPMQNMYRGPVMVITGQHDLPYCGGDCLATGGAASSIPATVQKNFPSTNITTVVQPATGHGINFHYNSTAAYDVMNHYLNGKGLQSR